MVCRYFDQFHSGVQELAKEQIGRQREQKAAALRATSYAVPEITVIPHRGGAGPTVRLELMQPRTAQSPLPGYHDEYEDKVARAVQKAAKVLRWAGSGAPTEDVRGVSATKKERLNLAFQTMKMLPESGITSVRIGGRLVGDSAIEMKPAHASQIMSIIEEEQAPTEVDLGGHIRAIDL